MIDRGAAREAIADSAGEPLPALRETGNIRGGVLQASGWALLAIAALHLAYTWNAARPLVAIYLLALVELARQDRWRLAFYPGLMVGFCIGVLQLKFFFVLFSFGAVALWLVFGFWIGLFVAMARLALRRFGSGWGLAAVPFLWLGLEYFRSELYYLRFTWLTPGLAFTNPPWELGLRGLGAYGAGFVIMAMVCGVIALRTPWLRMIALGTLVATLASVPGIGLPGVETPARERVHVAGVQMEFPTEHEVLISLRELLKKHPEAELVVLSEYTFDDVVPQKVLDWCTNNRRYLVVGGKEPLENGTFYNTAYVIGPGGQVVFRQAKAVPIQFMKDGLKAESQQVWNSPWGKIGICICYDLSYTRVTDVLVKQGAEVLIVPTMDVIDWGEAQHVLHARVAPARAAEYGLPIFRVASSGISQHVNAKGRTLASAPCPGDGAFIAGDLEFRGAGRCPLDRRLAPFCAAGTGGFGLFCSMGWVGKWLGRLRKFADRLHKTA